jgi:hypothetical protein
MYPRTQYEMTQDDLGKLLAAMRSVPMIMLQCGTPPSQQENANAAWARLGIQMGFDPMTVQPTGKGDKFFTAIPSETPLHKQEREQREKKLKREQELQSLTERITELQQQRDKLLG